MEETVAILGRQPEISAAELWAVLGATHALEPLCDTVLRIGGTVNPKKLIVQLGGTVKIGHVFLRISRLQELRQDHILTPILSELEKHKGKISFGMSFYGSVPSTQSIRAVEKLLKSGLVANGRSARFVRAEHGVLSSVVVQKQLLNRGAELLIVQTPKDVVIAITDAVQPFEEFSERDYGRPARNARSGMLPPKLARIMLNLAQVQKNSVVLDPFCGSGTVLQEAALLGVQHIIGTDADAQAIDESEKNIAWLHQQLSDPDAPANTAAIRIEHIDARSLRKKVAANSIHAVVTEPFLGPPGIYAMRDDELERAIQRLQKLYSDVFTELHHALRMGGVVVFLFPVFLKKTSPVFLAMLDDVLLRGYKLRQPLPPHLTRQYKPRLSFRHTLLYKRPGQFVAREILIFEKT